MRLSASLVSIALTIAACGSSSTPDASAHDAIVDRTPTTDSNTSSDASNAMDVASQPDANAMDVASQPDANAMDVASGQDSATGSDAAQDSTSMNSCRSNADCPGRACLGITTCGGTGRCGTINPCPNFPDPVCGCDGRTYTNACMADNAGVGIRSRGECPSTDAGSDAAVDARPGLCRSNDDCMRGEVCQDIMTCGGTGTCRSPGPCPLVYRPVCGCDGRTYGNACELSNAGVGLRSEGPCPDAGTRCSVPEGCCATDTDCRSPEYCAPIDGCVHGMATGVCKTRPEAGRCWRDADCPSGGGRLGVCRGANICPCGARCLIADSPGTCV